MNGRIATIRNDGLLNIVELMPQQGQSVAMYLGQLCFLTISGNFVFLRPLYPSKNVGFILQLPSELEWISLISDNHDLYAIGTEGKNYFVYNVYRKFFCATMTEEPCVFFSVPNGHFAYTGKSWFIDLDDNVSVVSFNVNRRYRKSCFVDFRSGKFFLPGLSLRLSSCQGQRLFYPNGYLDISERESKIVIRSYINEELKDERELFDVRQFEPLVAKDGTMYSCFMITCRELLIVFMKKTMICVARITIMSDGILRYSSHENYGAGIQFVSSFLFQCTQGQLYIYTQVGSTVMRTNVMTGTTAAFVRNIHDEQWYILTLRDTTLIVTKREDVLTLSYGTDIVRLVACGTPIQLVKKEPLELMMREDNQFFILSYSKGLCGTTSPVEYTCSKIYPTNKEKIFCSDGTLVQFE